MVAIFSEPVSKIVQGGMHLGVDVICLYEGKFVLFEKSIEGKKHEIWFPWGHLNYGEDPEDAAARVLNEWGNVKATSLKIVNFMSITPPGSDWHLIVQFVAELAFKPKPGDGVKEIKTLALEELPERVGFLEKEEILKMVKT